MTGFWRRDPKGADAPHMQWRWSDDVSASKSLVCPPVCAVNRGT